MGEFQALRSNLAHRLPDSECWNNDLFADLAEAIPVIAYRSRNVNTALLPNQYVAHFNRDQRVTATPNRH